MRTNHTCPSRENCPGSLSIRFEPMPLDGNVKKRAEFVNSVCAALIDSRFGPGRFVPMVYHFSREKMVDRPILFDMTDAGPVPSYTILPDSEMARRYAFAIRQEAIAEMAERQVSPGPEAATVLSFSQQTSPPALARGSPCASGTQMFSLSQTSDEQSALMRHDL